MGGWTGEGKDTIIWDGDIVAKNFIGGTSGGTTTDALKLDQTIPQTIINGKPIFNTGLIINNSANSHTLTLDGTSTDGEGFTFSQDMKGDFTDVTFEFSGEVLRFDCGTNYFLVDYTGVIGNAGVFTSLNINTTKNFSSQVATGTAPYQCTSTTLNTNLNADLLDGYHASSFAITADLAGYEKLDGTNQPATGNKNISKADPEIRITDTGNSEYSRIVKTDTDNKVTRYNRVAQPDSNAYAFNGDGTRLDDVAISDQTDFSMTNGTTDIPFSVSAWIYMNASGASGVVVGKGTSTSTAEYFLRINTSNQIYFRLYSDGATSQYRRETSNSGYTWTDGWHHIGMTYTVGGAIVLYRDGAAVASTSTDSASYAKMINTTSILSLGNMLRGDTTNFLGCNGKLDDVAIWKNRVLSANEMADIYASGTGLKLDPTGTFPTDATSMGTGLVGLWHLDEGTGTSAVDSSGKGYNGTNNGAWTTGFDFPTPTIEGKVFQYYDGIDAYERGRLQFGDYATSYGTYNILEGLSHRYNILGSTKEVLSSTGHSHIDNWKLFLGTADDSSIYYDGTDLIINPKDVGSGKIDILGVIQTDGYKSTDGSSGVSGSFTTADGKTITIKDGIVTAIV